MPINYYLYKSKKVILHFVLFEKLGEIENPHFSMPKVPTIGQNSQPFTSHGDVSIWVKNYRVGRKTPNNQPTKQTNEQCCCDVFYIYNILDKRNKKSTRSKLFTKKLSTCKDIYPNSFRGINVQKRIAFHMKGVAPHSKISRFWNLSIHLYIYILNGSDWIFWISKNE